jgi:hypothetical protein
VDLIARMKATQKTVDRFKGQAFDMGRVDCIRLAAAHARHAGRRIRVPDYGDRVSAARALRAEGHGTLHEAMDAHFERIAASRVMIGDYVETPGTEGFSAVMVALGNGRALGFHEDIPHCDVLQPLIIIGAWSLG